MCYWKYRGAYEATVHRPSFNPSYTGCATGRIVWKDYSTTSRACFNPSYTGCATGSAIGLISHHRPKEFQSFLYWMCYWKSATTMSSCPPFGTFQSFLYWMCYWKLQLAENQCCAPDVSILLILDVLLEVGRAAWNSSRYSSFNPSYTGCATGSTAARVNFSESENCFNPSYTGCATGSAHPFVFRHVDGKFQSFLYWMCYWKFKEIGVYNRNTYVSILLILDVLLEVKVVDVS